jgi:hypothetical protein
MNTSAKNLLDFLTRAGETGRIKPEMAASLSSATKKVLEIEQDWEELDVHQIDMDDFLTRFRNLKSLEYTPNSLSEYERRFKRAVDMFLGFVQDPSGWKHNGKANGGQKNKTKNATSKTKGKVAQPTSGEAVEISTVTINSAGIQMMDYPFPLRESCVVRLRLPSDLKVAEVERLAAFMRSVAVDLHNKLSGDLSAYKSIV